MRLMNARTGRLETFVGDNPRYAILSHTWGNREVTFADVPRTRHPASYKIANTCRLAQEQGLSYVWIDTCCIDKSSSAELTESINSMFKWYQESVVCYVYLEDFDLSCASLAGCRWFTRGWTLQELLAPTTVEFYDKSWNLMGTKGELIDPISTITHIPTEVLKGEKSFKEFSVASRMSWAAGRKTSKLEDIAYSLLGLFNVHMPPIYGEGKNAFRRLQEEIIKYSNDLTILAWCRPQFDGQPAVESLGLFAESPDCFHHRTTIHPSAFDFTTRFAITNQGLHVSGDTRIRLISVADGEKKGAKMLYAISLGYETTTHGDGGIYLRKVGPNLFCRDFQLPLAGFHDGNTFLQTLDVPNYYILIDPSPLWIYTPLYRKRALHVPHNSHFRVEDAVPATLWDHSDQMFLNPKPGIQYA
ncbi:hypothetical protein E8E14_008479 [Neopestalotiopsis sp. 37M]|nr:hypothetical protein E8E14_008479 [Neopestalotiopsis sp. 37M]